MKIIAALRKGSEAAHTSHLDLQRTLQRVFRRADLPLKYSAGFNPHPLLSFATALATGATSDGEWFEVELEQPPSERGELPGAVTPEEFLQRANAQMPAGLSLWGAFEAPEGLGSLTKLLTAAEYEVQLYTDRPIARGQAETALAALLGKEEVLAEKKTKQGKKSVNIRPCLLEASLADANEEVLTLAVTGALTASGGLRSELVGNALLGELQCGGRVKVHRKRLLFGGPWAMGQGLGVRS